MFSTSFSPFSAITREQLALFNSCIKQFSRQWSIMAAGRSFLWLSTEQQRRLRLLPFHRGVGFGVAPFRDGRPPAALSERIR
jgi:hypothetical protein